MRKRVWPPAAARAEQELACTRQIRVVDGNPPGETERLDRGGHRSSRRRAAPEEHARRAVRPKDAFDMPEKDTIPCLLPCVVVQVEDTKAAIDEAEAVEDNGTRV
ncbi:MAG: hypothetical protein IT379_14690 [Deltaproteobacteria bacterium]|nr:hypothetical protein [Deltaproteobacteria bacterium]